MGTVIDTRGLPPKERLAHIRQLAIDLPEPVDVRTDHPHAFRSLMQFAPLGEVVVGCLETEGLVDWRVHRTRQLIRRSDPESYVLLVSLEGHTGTAQLNRQTILAPGEMGLYSTSEPNLGWRRARGAPARAAMIAVPRAALPCHPSRVNALLGERLTKPTGMGALMLTMVRQIVADVGQYQPAEAARISTLLLDLLAALVAQRLDLQPTLATVPSRQVLLLRIQAFIEANLADRDLCPATVAAAHHISVRTLYRVFDDSGSTATGWIRTRRLERCRQDLANPLLAARPVDSIARSWGFADGAQLSRLFRAAYGMPPRAFRLSRHDTNR
ncbi:helix-turn-helix domain-containing protein [Hamadaea sp. NPDC051192]|uniref:helix-turn-helix domain-containing protein n=1 Tax=Hamadaea sp. NPDC051192 TaxID=3154940 RepID=UPI0034412D1C